jgi:glycosyltransferase involved in cell wall biosynthesis
LRVSIITPSFNQADFLEETIRSVLDQNYPDLEYFVIDGGSQDGSPDIIRKYGGQLTGWVSEPDSGQAEAINKGFARATGEIVAWVNSDDYYLPGAIQAAVTAFQEKPECALVYGDVVAINGAGEPINVMTSRQWTLEDLMQFRIIGQPSVFMRRSALMKTGFLDQSYHYMLDHHLWLRMAQQGPMRYVPERWSAARYHAGAKNVAHTNRYGLDAFRLVEWMQQDPALAPHFRQLRRRVLAGAHRVNAHYLLDGGQYRPALSAYLRSLVLYPPLALPDLKRVLFAAASLVINVDALKQRYLKRRKQVVADRLSRGGGSPV